MSPGIVHRAELCSHAGQAVAERKRLKKGLYFCLVQSLPTPSCYVFSDVGEYILGCSCTKHTSGTLVTLPLGAPPECKGTCCYLRVKVRERSISVRQFSQTPPSSTGGKESLLGEFHFFKETAGKGLEVFAQVDSAEDCTFRMFPVYGGNGKPPASDELPVCSFCVRRVLLGAERPSSTRSPGGVTESETTSTGDGVRFFTEYEASVFCPFEVFQDVRIGKGGNGEVFLGIHRIRVEAVAIKREPKDMLRHEFSLICDIRLDGPLLTYKAQDPHPSKFLGLLAHSVAVEVGNSAVAAAIAHHSAAEDDHDYLTLELVTGGELRKLLKTKYASGMPIVCGLALIHSKRIIHRDLKTQNILVRHGETYQGDELKIIDFGNSARVKPGSVFMKNYTTCFACAPEQFALTEKGYGYGIDIWALGTIFFELLTGERLFDCLNISEASRQIPAFTEQQVEDRLPYLGHGAKEFLLSCLTKDPEKRPTALQLLTTPFLFPVHIYQIRRRVETTDVYNSYMKAFEKGWGNLQPIKSLSMIESHFFDSATRSFTPEYQDSEVVNVVLPVFECVPDFQSQDRGIRIHNWILASDASFHMASTRVEALDGGSNLPGAGRGTIASISGSRNNSVHSFTSDGSPQNIEESSSNPSLNKLLSDSQLFHSSNSVSKCGQATLQCSLTCSTASLGSPMPASLFFGGADQPMGSEGTFEALADRIDSL